MKFLNGAWEVLCSLKTTKDTNEKWEVKQYVSASCRLQLQLPSIHSGWPAGLYLWSSVPWLIQKNQAAGILLLL